MENHETQTIIRDYIKDIIHLSLATTRDNKPWVCEVHFSYDEDLSLYFISRKTRRHSEDIAANPNVAGNIVRQHQKGEKPLGVYFEGRAEVVDSFEATDRPFATYHERFSTDESWISGEYSILDGHRIYKISVSDFYVFNGNKEHLEWGRG